MRIEFQTNFYNYSYSFDGENWTTIPIDFYSYKLSDDYIDGGGFFTGAFVGMQCQDTSGQNLHADFDYFVYQRSEEHTSELQSRFDLVCRLLLEKKNLN